MGMGWGWMGLHTSTIKLKFHMGIVDNEMAHKMANEARDAAACQLLSVHLLWCCPTSCQH